MIGCAKSIAPGEGSLFGQGFQEMYSFLDVEW